MVLTSVIPVSAVVATQNRSLALRRTLSSLATQSTLPKELILVDASEDYEGESIAQEWNKEHGHLCSVHLKRVARSGAAAQRNEGVEMATQPFIWFFDDDIIFDPECVSRIWRALEGDGRLGGVNAMIKNQQYSPPGRWTSLMLFFMGARPPLAGKVHGPAINLLPLDSEELPEVVSVDWLNTTCTIYRREALMAPPFPAYFQGYSLMEDVAVSLMVGRKWKLANARTARIYHDSQPGLHKSDPDEVAFMQLTNRHYVMAQILGKTSWLDKLRLVIWDLFSAAGGLFVSPHLCGWRGRAKGIVCIFFQQASQRGSR